MPTPSKIDLAKLHKADYAASRKPVLLTIKPAAYLAIEGQGEPGGIVFEEKIGALYGMAFTVKMTRKFGGQQDYTVGKLEAQWWGPGGTRDFGNLPKAQWCWKLLIRTPEFVGADELDRAATALRKRGKAPAAREVKLETLDEGQCVQMLHVGPYEREGETVAVMQAFAAERGLQFQGWHHEIYISDPRRVPPDRLKTILREPVKKRASNT